MKTPKVMKLQSLEEINHQLEKTGRACPKCRYCGADTMYLDEYHCYRHPELSHVHCASALQCEYYVPLSDEELEHRFNIEWPEDQARFHLSFYSTGTEQINDAIRALAKDMIKREYFTWQELEDIYLSLDPRVYDDWPRKIMAIAKLCETISDQDLSRPTPEEKEEERSREEEFRCHL